MTTSQQESLLFVPMREDHIGVVMDMEMEAYPEPWTKGMFREEVRGNRSYFCVTMIDETLMGYCGFWLILDEAHITSVTVAESHRGRGFGRQQVAHLLVEAEERGARIATLEVRESNYKARKLYDTMGFACVGLRKGYYSKTNEDAIIMVCELG